MTTLKGSPYLAWSKSRAGIRYNLARSGVVGCPPEALELRDEDRALNGPNLQGWPPLLERLARRHRVEPSQVVLAHGGSMANHLACAALLDAGDRVLVETPCYEPLHALPRYLGAVVEFFARRPEAGYDLEPERIAPLLEARPRLLVLSDLHNPTGARAGREALQALVRLAEQREIFVLVDEVYLEFLQGDDAPTAARLSPWVVATRSLTKAYGLDGLRVGWIVAAPEVAARIRRLNDLFSISLAHPSERIAARALDRAEALLAPTRRRVARQRGLVEAFVASQPRLRWMVPAGGTVGLIHMDGGDVDALAARLESDFEATVAPGRFFGAPGAFRVGFGMEEDVLRGGLERLSRALAGA